MRRAGPDGIWRDDDAPEVGDVFAVYGTRWRIVTIAGRCAGFSARRVSPSTPVNIELTKQMASAWMHQRGRSGKALSIDPAGTVVDDWLFDSALLHVLVDRECRYHLTPPVKWACGHEAPLLLLVDKSSQWRALMAPRVPE